MALVKPIRAGSDNLQAILAMVAAMAIFVIGDTLIKLASSDIPPGQAIFIRGLFMSAFCGALLVRGNVLLTLPRSLTPKVLWRAVADVGGTVLFLTALPHMAIADAYAILQFSPLAITAGAALFLGAQVGWRRWSATCVGLIGVLIVLRPGGSAFAPQAFLVIAALLCGVARDLVTRGVPAGIPGIVIVSASVGVVTVASLGLALVEDWTWPTRLSLLALLVAALAAMFAQHCIIVAMRTGDIAVVAPFRYTVILWAVLSGFVVWREVPDLPSWVGIAIVTTAGLYTFLREQKLARMSRS